MPGYYRKITKWNGYDDRHKRRVPVRRRTAENSHSPCDFENAPILILDEATAFADPDNEVRVQQALSALSKGKTVIMIAHRLSSIKDADCIYVLQNGEIVESGTHSRLIEKNGIFARMWKNYSEAAEWKIARR